jgi:hypothetical protein
MASIARDKLAHWLCDNFERDMPMVCRDKRPVYKHANGEWTWAKYRSLEPIDHTLDVGILLSDICVVDVDDHALASELEDKFPILKTVPRETTRKGMHYFFKRSDVADRGGYYDSRSPVIQSVDFKTRCQNGTRGLVVTTPSTDKKWIAAPWDVPLLTIPDDLLAAVAMPTHRPVNATIRFDDGSTLPFVESTLISRCIAFQPVFDDTDTCDNLPVIGFPRDAFEDMVDIIELRRPTRVMTAAQLECTGELSRYVGVASDDARPFDYGHPSSFAHGMLDLAEVCPEAAECAYAARAESRLTPVVSGVAYVPIRGLSDPRWLFHNEVRPGDIGEVMHGGDDLAARAWTQLPPVVRKILAEHAGHVMLGGGAAVSLASPHVSAGSDYDLFVFGKDAVGATEIVWDAMEIARAHEPKCVVAKTGSAVTFYFGEAEKTVVQIILKLYASPSDVLSSFDVTACQVGLWRSSDTCSFMGTPAWHVSMRHLFFWVDPATFAWSTSSVTRIFKYYAKGFDVFFPGLKREALMDDAHLLARPSDEGMQYKRCEEPGMMNLFHVEAIMHRRETARAVRHAVEHTRKWGRVACDAAAVARAKGYGGFAKIKGCLPKIKPRPFSGALRPCVLYRIAEEASQGPIQNAWNRDVAAFALAVSAFAYKGYHRDSGYGDELMASPQTTGTFYAIWKMIEHGWRWLEGATSPVRGSKSSAVDMAALMEAKSVKDVAKVLEGSWEWKRTKSSFFKRSPRVARIYDMKKYVGMGG